MLELEKIKNLTRYDDFTWLEPHQLFSRYFKDRDFDIVQIHDPTPTQYDDIIGFVGAFHWKDNQLTPADGDSYTPNMMVIGYEEFEIHDTECPDYHKGLDILVEEW